MSPLSIDLQLACNASACRDRSPSLNTLQHWADAVAASTQAHGDVCVRLVDADEIQALNQQFRQRDNVTNVLSFPATPPVLDAADLDSNDHAQALTHLGDIVICCTRVESEALAQGKAVQAHYAHMLVHGLLHLLGYDHLDDVEANAMETLEIQILASLEVGDPYQHDHVTGCADSRSTLASKQAARQTPEQAINKSAG